MAKRKKMSAATKAYLRSLKQSKRGGTLRVQENIVVRQAAPLVRPKRRHHGGGGLGGVIGGAAMHAQIIAPGTAGYIVGTAEKNGLLDNIPDIPIVGDLLGKKGSALLIIHVLKPQATGIVRDVKIFLGGLCGYELAKDGKISGI